MVKQNRTLAITHDHMKLHALGLNDHHYRLAGPSFDPCDHAPKITGLDLSLLAL